MRDNLIIPLNKVIKEQGDYSINGIAQEIRIKGSKGQGFGMY